MLELLGRVGGCVRSDRRLSQGRAQHSRQWRCWVG